MHLKAVDNEYCVRVRQEINSSKEMMYCLKLD